ncbi:MAG: glycosyltransferase [Gemmatimonadaceae bacterium]
MTNGPNISVVITAHNAAATLAATLTALAAQSNIADGEMEIVVVDDRSTDETATLLASLRMSSARTLRIDSVPSLSTCTARQYALDVAVRATRAPYVLVLDADAVPPTGWVRAVAAALCNASVVAGGVAFVSLSDAWPRRLLAALQTVDAAYYLGWCRLLARSGAPSGMLFGAAGFRRELYDRSGGFCALGFTLTEDLAFVRAVHRLNATIHFLTGEPVTVRACGRWRDVIGRALRTGTTGGRSLLATTLGIWGLLLPALGVGALIIGGAWWMALTLRYLAGVAFAMAALRRIRRLRLVGAALLYEPTALVLAVLVAATAWHVREIEWGGVRYPRQGSSFAPRV